MPAGGRPSPHGTEAAAAGGHRDFADEHACATVDRDGPILTADEHVPVRRVTD